MAARFQDVLPVHLAHRNAVSPGPLRDLGGRHPAEGRSHPVVVVLHDEDDGEPPNGSHVLGLVEGALVHRGISHEAEADLISAPILDGPRYPGSQGNLPPHDAVASHEALLHTEDVHGAALP